MAPVRQPPGDCGARGTRPPILWATYGGWDGAGAYRSTPAPLSTEKYLPRLGGGLAGLARKGRGLGKTMVSPALAIYWMKSMWGASPSSCSMLSLAARCRWKWCRLGEPVQRKTDHLPKPSQHQAHCPHLSQASRHQPGPGESIPPHGAAGKPRHRGREGQDQEPGGQGGHE